MAADGQQDDSMYRSPMLQNIIMNYSHSQLVASNSNVSPVNVCENYILKLEQCIYLLTKLNKYNNNVLKIKIICSV